MVPLTAWPQVEPAKPNASEPIATASALRWMTLLRCGLLRCGVRADLPFIRFVPHLTRHPARPPGPGARGVVPPHGGQRPVARTIWKGESHGTPFLQFSRGKALPRSRRLFAGKGRMAAWSMPGKVAKAEEPPPRERRSAGRH